MAAALTQKGIIPWRMMKKIATEAIPEDQRIVAILDAVLSAVGVDESGAVFDHFLAILDHYPATKIVAARVKRETVAIRASQLVPPRAAATTATDAREQPVAQAVAPATRPTEEGE